MNIQPTLETEHIKLVPLEKGDFESLYAVASDPAIWVQHPNKDRWKKAVFENFFEGAMQSKGAFKVVDKASGEMLGSTRFYDYDEQASSILIGYTFYAGKCWGKGINHAVKRLMLAYAFRFVDKVHFHIGASNVRSQVSIERLGASKVGEQVVTYFGESPKLNYVYEIDNASWESYVSNA
jgi:RimJ/RimL family protein N-acetyltransferase